MQSKDAQRIRNYVQSLQRDDRYILMLFYADGLTALEIGALLGLSAAKVDTRLSYFRDRLGNMLHEQAHHAGGGPRPTAFA
mgnify:CR=1 FL=1